MSTPPVRFKVEFALHLQLVSQANAHFLLSTLMARIAKR